MSGVADVLDDAALLAGETVLAREAEAPGLRLVQTDSRAVYCSLQRERDGWTKWLYLGRRWPSELLSEGEG